MAATHPSPPHAVLFPFMSKGHTIPILQLARLLLSRGLSVTIFTTPANRPFISDTVSDTDAAVVVLPFPEKVDGIPNGVESTDSLPSISLFIPFATATKFMKPHFEGALKNLPKVTFMITDGFLGWALDSASEFGIPRLAFYGMSVHANTLCYAASKDWMRIQHLPNDEWFHLIDFPWIKLTKNHFGKVLTEPSGPDRSFAIDCTIHTTKSYGIMVNSFYQLEQVFVDYAKGDSTLKQWLLGPLCLAEPKMSSFEHKNDEKSPHIQWLNQKHAEGKSVLYVAFGTQAEISSKQFEEIKRGLEESGMCFLWVVRKKEHELDEFKERVKHRGLVMTSWVQQRDILEHECVRGFLSHCGWNSVVESISAKVPILAWPMMAEQHLNAMMVVEEIKVGMQVETYDGSVGGFVTWEGLKKAIQELMEGERGKEAFKKVEEVGQAAINAMGEGGSSWNSLNELIHELCSRESVNLVPTETPRNL